MPLHRDKKRFAIFLTGCGHLDGTEIREAVATFYALDKHGADFTCYATYGDIDVVNHFLNKPEKEQRVMLHESARLARGNILGTFNYSCEYFDGVIFPGGYGVVKNLTSFEEVGHKSGVDMDISGAIHEAFYLKKPMGFICISPILPALALKRYAPLTLTFGDSTKGGSKEVADEIKKLGHNIVDCPVTECVVDEKNKIVSTPAYMYEKASITDIFTGVEKLVLEMMKL
jgi:enhancing lycopene biosynthesis protein 2